MRRDAGATGEAGHRCQIDSGGDETAVDQAEKARRHIPWSNRRHGLWIEPRARIGHAKVVCDLLLRTHIAAGT